MSHSAHNEAFGDFGLAEKRPPITRDALAALAIAVGVALLGAQCVTQWLARALDYQAALGQPLCDYRGTLLYAPWSAITWSGALRDAIEGERLAQQADGWLRFVVMLSLVVGGLVFAKRLRDRQNRAALLHGSARWANREEVERTGLLSRTGVFVGRWVDKQSQSVRDLRHDGPQHVFAYAPTRAGKGVGLVLPTLLTWPGSVFVLDPKGENFAKTSGYRASLGHRVYKLDVGKAATARFNPLASIRIGTEYEVADVQNIADSFTDPGAKGGGEGAALHFALAAKGLLTAAILHVLYREASKKRTASLLDVANELSDPARSHAEVLRAWLEYSHDPALAQKWRHVTTDDPTATHPIVAMYARQQLNRDEKERSAVLSSALVPFEPFADPLLAKNVSTSDFNVEDLMHADVPVAVYFVLSPRDEKRLKIFARLFIELLLRRLTEEHPPLMSSGTPATARASRWLARWFRTATPVAPAPKAAKSDRRLLLMLDEFPTLGRIDVISSAMAIMAGYGLRAYLIAQNYKQLIAAYGNNESITANCHITVAFPTNDHDTAKRLSDMTGRATVIKRQRPMSTLFSPTRQRGADSESEVSRPLLTPDECMRLPGPVTEGERIVEGGDMLVFCAGSRPIYGRQPLYFQDPQLLARSQMPPALPRPLAQPSGVQPTRTTPHAPDDAGATEQAHAAILESAKNVLAPPALLDFSLDPELLAIGGANSSDLDDVGDDAELGEREFDEHDPEESEAEDDEEAP